MGRLKGLALVLVGLIWVLQGCTYKLSLNGASIPAALKTIRVEFFENTAPLVVNTLSQQFTEALKERIRNQTSLSVVNGEADAVMSGTITDYNIAPVSVQATNNTTAPIADQTRLTITVNVKYTYDADKKLSFEQPFTKYKDFKGELATVEQSLIADINKQLTEDIFNRAFANWD
ncbi:MAG: LptE family protein [Mucilaginibacter sp.]|uniref:LptE family protein n=1 Tax=Mucilaginibacter sp. L3T2-6 TaxID=3062491 RepID=UPI00267562C8|nr:LptE family protein [Mucilaginibacter sp. L3T2-6]MDO3645319.1 LptE family protein [Mucilaginibacter sp. L3T2-6]MDV6217812.1 LptE family protein [Mucilaginibacter sp. L3T2-6]